MNKNIREIERQCWNNQSNHIDTERFAELIVTECAKVVDENETSSPFENFGDMIKHHFGVK